MLASVSVPAGDERLIVALPPSEIPTHRGAPHFTQRHARHDLLGAVLYLMCNDLNTTIEELKTKDFATPKSRTPSSESRRRSVLPSGGEMGLYEPSQPAIENGNRDVANRDADPFLAGA